MIGKNIVVIGAGAAIAGIALWIYVKKKGGIADAAADAANSIAYGMGEAVAGATWGAVDGAVSGVALTLGDKIGVPRTNMTECEKAKAEGRTLDASFACPALDFLDYVNPFK